ncbi:MAG: hypothetical protein HC780_28310 [Leptolyngbyaceae cyanobacterium CSU_1_3]|nr:hypothetical protein [Leptolyngbyaceae cyanobacterium CSU_1_3]
MNEAVRAERATVTFFNGLQVDGYRMPDGEFRVGITGACRVLGYPDNWLYLALEGQNRKRLRDLQSLGFTEQTQQIVSETSRGDRTAETINLRDFNRLIAYAVFDGKRAALALQLALTEVALNDFFRDAFGEPPLTIAEKRNLFYETYARTISPEEWRQMDREDILRLALSGDEPHLRDGKWNS